MSFVRHLSQRQPAWTANAGYRALRLRHDWWFRWAHDPLCDRLGGGVLKLGKLRLCRGCLCLYAGVAAGAVVAVAGPVRVAATPAAPGLWVGAASATAVVSVPRVYGGLGRSFKDGVRFSTGVLGGLLLAFARAERWGVFAALAAGAASGYRVLTLARSKRKAQACDGCPELEAQGICSGYAQQAVSLRAYERAASDRAMAARARLH